MLLAVDIGNTNVTLGLFKSNRLLKHYTFLTNQKDYRGFLKKIILNNPIDGVIICSVVPGATKRLEKDLKPLSLKKPLIIGKDLIVPIKNLYRKPAQVGQDRLVNAYAGINLFKAPLIVIDFGTAITFDVISKNKEYLGGMILPGLNLSLDALAQKTALLPKTKLALPKEFIGRDTKNSMLSGLIYGFSALSDSLIDKIRRKIGRDALAIGTGGNIVLASKYAGKFDRIDIDLTLKGLNLLYSFYEKKR